MLSFENESKASNSSANGRAFVSKKARTVLFHKIVTRYSLRCHQNVLQKVLLLVILKNSYRKYEALMRNDSTEPDERNARLNLSQSRLRPLEQVRFQIHLSCKIPAKLILIIVLSIVGHH